MPLDSDIQICELTPPGIILSKTVAVIGSPYEEEIDDSSIYRFYDAPPAADWDTFDPKYLVWHRLRWLDARRYHLSLWDVSSEEDVRAYAIPLAEAFHLAARSYPQIAVDPDVMAGARRVWRASPRDRLPPSGTSDRSDRLLGSDAGPWLREAQRPPSSCEGRRSWLRSRGRAGTLLQPPEMRTARGR